VHISFLKFVINKVEGACQRPLQGAVKKPLQVLWRSALRCRRCEEAPSQALWRSALKAL